MTSQPLDLSTDGCYLIHADKPLHHAQHYIGYSDNIAERIESHRKGKGSKLIAAFNKCNISWSVVHIWPSKDRSFERKLHRMKCSPRICPICKHHVVCSECHNRLSPSTTFFYDGLVYCPDCLPYYDKHQQW